MAEDFFVRFGSNAPAFGRQLDTDLAAARRAIGTFSKQLSDLETTAANRRAATMKHLAAMSQEATRVQRQLDSIGAAHESAGISPEVADVKRIAQDAMQDIASATASLDAVISRMDTFIRGIDRADSAIAAERESINRSAAQKGRTDQVRDPQTGQTRAAGTAGTVAFRDIERIAANAATAATAAATGQTPVQIENIPRATIDEAAFQRVVAAVERNVTATERVEAAVDRLGGRLSGGEPGTVATTGTVASTPTVEAVAPVVEAERGPSKRQVQLDSTISTLSTRERELRQELEQLASAEAETGQQSAKFTRQLNELGEVEKKLASARQARASEETRAEQQERQRRAAQRQAAIENSATITPEERRYRQDERARLELAADPDQLASMVGRGQGKIGKQGLQDIAETLTRQGYPVDLGAMRERNGRMETRLSNDDLLKAIKLAGQEYAGSGRITAEDLSPRRVQAAATVIPDEIKNLLSGELPQVSQRFTQELGRLGLSVEQAYKLIGANLRSGGQDPRRYNGRGRLEVGSEIGEELRPQLMASADAITSYDWERRKAARGDVVSAMRQDQYFNPYDVDRSALSGAKDPSAQQARRDLSALLRATEEVDQFATGLGKLDDALRDAQRYQERVLRQLDEYESLERKPTAQENQAYTAGLAEAEKASQLVAERRARLEQEKSLFADPNGGSADFMLEPGFRAGLERRTASRTDQEEQASAQRAQAQDAFLSRAALRDAVFEYFGGAHTFATNDGNTKDYFSRNLPGVRSAGSLGRQRLAFADDDMNSTAENRAAMRSMNAGIVGYTSRLNALIDDLASGDRSEEELNQARERVTQALGKLLGGYQRAFPQGQAPEAEKFLPPELGFNNNWLDRAYASRDENGRVQDESAMAEIWRQNQSGRNADRTQATLDNMGPADPAQLQQELLKTIRARIKAINAEIKGLGDEDAARRPLLEAEREQLRAARKRASGRVDPADLEQQHAAILETEQRLARAEANLERATATLARAREEAPQELAHREEFVRGSLSPESLSQYDAARAQRSVLERQVAAARANPDLRADTALGSAGAAAAERAQTQLSTLESELSRVNATLMQYERLAHSVNPNTAFNVNQRPGAYANTETEGIQAGVGSLEEGERALRTRVSAINQELGELRNMFAASSTAFREQQSRRGDKAMRDPNVPGFGDGGSGNGTGGSSTALGGAEPPRGNILSEILAVLNRIDGRLKGTLKVSGNLTATRAAQREMDGEAPAPRATPNRTDRLPRSSAEGRADFEGSIAQTIPAVGQLLDQGKDVQAAAELVQRGVLSETRVLDLFRDKLKQTTAEAKAFKEAVRTEVGNQRLMDAASAAAAQRQAEEQNQFQTRGGDNMSFADARREMEADLTSQKKKADTLARVQREQREAALAEADYAKAMSRLTPATQAEIAELERMAKSTDQSAEAQARLAAQMAKVYGMVAQNLNSRASETNAVVGQVYKGAGVESSGGEVANMRNSARSMGYQVDRDLAAGIAQGDGMLEQAVGRMFGPQGFWGRVIGSTGAFVVRNFTAGFVFGLTNALQGLVAQAVQAEAIFVRVSDALEETGQSTQGLRSDLRGLAVQYGVSLQDVYETTAGLTGLFDNPEDLKGGVEVVTQLQRISMGALNANEAMGILSATIGGFGDQLGTGLPAMNHVADVLTTIQNNLGVNVETSSEGVGSMAGLAKSLKIDFEDAAVYVAQIAKLTNQTGAGAGEGFSRVLAAMQTGRGRQVLTQNLPNSGIQQQLEKGDYGAALKTLLTNWNSLTDAQQRNIEVTLGGQRQARIVAALFADTGKVLNTVAKAHDADGEAAKRNAEIMKTMNAQVGVLQANFSSLADNLLDSGVADSIGVILVLINSLLKGVNFLLSGLNDLADKSSFTHTLLEWGAGIAGFMVLVNLLIKSLSGLKGSLASMRNVVIGQTASEVAAEGAAGEAAAGSGWTGLRGGAGKLGEQSNRLSGRLSGAAANAATAAEQAATNRAALGYGALSRSASVASTATGKVASGLDRLSKSGTAAMIGMGLVTAAIVTLVSDVMAARQRDSDVQSRIDKDFNPDGTPKSAAEKAAPEYVGPYSQMHQENLKATTSYGSTLKELATAPFRDGNLTSKDAWFGGVGNLLDRAQGGLTDGAGGDEQERLDKLHYAVLTRLHSQITAPIQTVKDLNKTQRQIGKMLDDARNEIINNGDLSTQEKDAALAQIEELEKTGVDNIITKLRGRAAGLKAADSLTTDQINELTEVGQLLQANAGTGNDQAARVAGQMVKDRGLDESSTLYKNLKKLAQGGFNSADALKVQAEAVSKELTNANQKYRTMLSSGTGDVDEIASQRQLVLQKAQELVTLTEQRLQAIISDANAIADLQTARGHYGAAVSGIEQAIRNFHAARSNNESPAVRAQNNMVESQAAEQAAANQAAGQNVRLETAKARGVGAQQSASLDEEIARNTYQALIEEKRVAQAAGTEGPSIKAIHDAKIAWLQAQHQSMTEAQNANIARMSLAMAQEWNAIAAGSDAEAIALQQYRDAVANFGKGSTEATNAATNLANVRKQNIQTQDQVTQAENEAALAAIPPGNTMAIARKTLQNARAALAAARKYGVNSVEYQGALQQLAAAQNGMMQASIDLVTSRSQVALALAQASGNTVKAAVIQVGIARRALKAALQNSGGAESPAVNQARGEVITAQAAARDARLQDSLDTIDFNLQMGRMTQSAAISALQHILKTADLTKQQRRQLLLQIKGYKDSISGDGQWNFGDIKLPTPYQMRRYVERNRQAMRDSLAAGSAAAASAAASHMQDASSTGGSVRGGNAHVVHHHSTTNQTTIQINGADVAKVRRVVEDVLSQPHRTRTAQPRRR